jgi:hypothetical protein
MTKFENDVELIHEVVKEMASLVVTKKKRKKKLL